MSHVIVELTVSLDGYATGAHVDVEHPPSTSASAPRETTVPSAPHASSSPPGRTRSSRAGRLPSRS
jgi:hypothetical protein